MNNYLQHYLIAVQHPDVSGFELLDMLMARDKLFVHWSSLTPQQQAQTAAADQLLLGHATEVVAELSRITDLNHERQQRNPSPEQWWWYLDVLSHTPFHLLPQHVGALVPA
jgi:hypothetical protein